MREWAGRVCRVGHGRLAKPIASTGDPAASGSPLAGTARAPICHDRKPPWVSQVASVRDGAPDPAGRIVFGEVSRQDIFGQTIGPLFAIDPDGSDLVQLFDCEIERPRFSPEGSRLAFSMYALSVLYGDRDHDGFKPAYSPDGSRIVFGCGADMCLMDADGSNVVTLVDVSGVELNHFAWGVNPP